MQVKCITILSTFIKLPFSIKTIVLSIFKWPLKTGLTVLLNKEIPTVRSYVLILNLSYNTIFVYCFELAPGIIGLQVTGLKATTVNKSQTVSS